MQSACFSLDILRKSRMNGDPILWPHYVQPGSELSVDTGGQDPVPTV